MSSGSDDLKESLRRMREEAEKKAATATTMTTPTITPELPRADTSAVPVTTIPSFAPSADQPLIFNKGNTAKSASVLDNDREYAERLWLWIQASNSNFLYNLQNSQKKEKYFLSKEKHKPDANTLTLKVGTLGKDILSEQKVDIIFKDGKLCLKALPNHNVFNENSAVSVINCARIIANKELEMHLDAKKKFIDDTMKKKFGENYMTKLPPEKIEEEKINCLGDKTLQQIFSFNIRSCESAKDLAIMLKEMSTKTPTLYAKLAPNVVEIAEHALTQMIDPDDKLDQSYKDFLRKQLQQQLGRSPAQPSSKKEPTPSADEDRKGPKPGQ